MRIPVFAAAAAVLLAGCQTTGGGASLQTHKPGDSAMGCEEIAQEIAAMDQIIGDADASETQRQMTESGVAVAQTAAIHSGAGNIVPGANLVGGLLSMGTQGAKDQKEKATLRRTSLMGMYQGKGCS